MARDKAKDDLQFNCSEKHEENYVVGLYTSDDKVNVRKLLQEACEDNRIFYSTHMEVYTLIQNELNLDIPVE